MARASKIGLGLMGLGLSLELILGLSGQGTALASECQPPPPCPCAADGTCYPKRDTWGTYKTKWRPWPGDEVGLEPTKAEETQSNIQQKLPPYQQPRPEQEELRGPADKLPARGAAEPAAPNVPGPITPAPNVPAPNAPAQPQPAEEDAQPAGEEFELPGLPGIPGLDPQGALPPGRSPQPLLQIEDGPPALPESLSASLAVTPYYSAPAHQVKPGLSVVANRSRAAVPSEGSAGVSPERDGRIVQATAEFQQASDIQLTNPAALHIYTPTDDELHQAIYLEANDD